MKSAIVRVQIHLEQDVVHARQRARLIAGLLGFDRQEQTRISTAVSEIVRNALQYAQGGEVAYYIEGAAPAQWLAIAVRDQGPGIANLDAILEGRYTSSSGMGLGLLGSRRLLPEHFNIDTRPGQGTTVILGRRLPPSAQPVTPALLGRIAQSLEALRAESPLEEFRTQNQELLSALELLRQRDEELQNVNRELIETNTGLVAIYTELDDKTRQLEQAEQVLRVRNEDLKGFAHTISHDLKAPLRGIAGYASELERKHQAGLSERARFCLSQIATATRNLDYLIDGLLHFARLDATTPSLAELNLRRLVAAILDDRRLLITEKGVELTVSIPDITLTTWESGLLQVLSNLIDNALKFSGKASPPRIEIRAEETEVNEVTGQAFRLVVSDNGIGFDMKYAERIFGLFNRMVGAEEFEGSGAGLAIAKKVVDKLGGSIRAEFQPGQGATFYVDVPGYRSGTSTRFDGHTEYGARKPDSPFSEPARDQT